MQQLFMLVKICYKNKHFFYQVYVTFSEHQILLASDFEHEREVTNAVTPQWVLSNLTTATSPSVCMQDKEVCHNLASLTLLAVVSEQVYS